MPNHAHSIHSIEQSFRSVYSTFSEDCGNLYLSASTSFLILEMPLRILKTKMKASRLNPRRLDRDDCLRLNLKTTTLNVFNKNKHQSSRCSNASLAGKLQNISFI